MSIVVASPTMNLVTGKFNISAVISTTTIVTGTVRITAPDGNYYYSSGNSASTFSLGTGSDLAGVAGTHTQNTINLPLDVNGNPQQGEYVFDYNYKEGSPVINYTPISWTYCFSAPTISLIVTVNCSVPVASFQDTTDYDVNGTTPTTTRAAVLTKNNNTPTFGSVNFTGETYLLAGEFYAGLYTVAMTTTLTYAFTNHNVYTQITGTNNALSVQCDTSACSMKCAISTLLTNMEASQTTNPKLYLQYEKQLILVNGYYNQYLLSVMCKDTTTRDSALAKVQAITGVTTGCCGSDENYLIIATTLCDCRGPVEFPETSSSTTDSEGEAYVILDTAYENGYIATYTGIGVWQRNGQSTW